MSSYRCTQFSKLQNMIMKTAIYTLLFLLFSISVSFTQTSLEGKITDASSGEPIIFGSVVLYKNDVLIKGVETDLDGVYFFADIDPGTYDIVASYIGYSPQKKVNVIVRAARVTRVDFNLSEGILMDAVEVIEYKMPRIDADITTSGSVISTADLRKLPNKSISAIAASSSGISSSPDGAVSIRGSRSDASVYYADGVRVLGKPAKMEGHATKSISVFDIASSEKITIREELPESGQITVGEWNDLHNWRDWVDLLQDESYGIMTERFEIRPTERYSVIVVNQNNAVIANVPVFLLNNKGETIWRAYTDNAGKAELWENAFVDDQNATSIQVGRHVKDDIVQIDEGSNTFVVQEECSSPQKMDIAFTVDATSSMNDEITYLRSELLDVIQRTQETNSEIDFRLGSVFYRDKNDEYLTRVSPLSDDITKTIEFVSGQNSNGGGDYPEAVDAALEETLKLDWREDALKIVFLILDAPPHENEETLKKIKAQIEEAASRGIKLIPVTASGINRETEFLMKFMAILTNGTYVFITDDSGIGNPHLDPVVDDYEVEKLNDCLVRLITQYSKSYSCDAAIKTEHIDVNVYPNPATQFINVKANSVPDKIKIYSANGMMVKSITPQEKETRIEMNDFVNGIYTLSIFIGDQVESRQIILLE